MNSLRGRPNITISDVAQHAGVSIKSVSRVINNEPHVSAKLRAKVESAISALKYVPDIAARSLAGARSFMIGLLFDNPSPSYTMNIMNGAYRACLAHKYHLRIDNLDTSSGTERLLDQLKLAIDHVRMDGIVITPPLSDNSQVLDLLDDRGIAYCRIGPVAFPGRSPAVMMDDAAAAARLADLLWESGHRRFGLVNGPLDHGSAGARREGFINRLQELDPVLEVMEAYGGYLFEGGIEGGKALLDRSDRPTAIFATNDDSAAGVMAACSQLGLRVPEQVSICGFDDSWIARSVWPFLTSIRQPVAEMAQAAAEMLLSQSRGDEKAKDQIFAYELIARDSVAAPPTG